MDQQVLNQALEKHSLWLETYGRKGERANLSGANLSGADFSEADLSWADLSGTDLSGTDLSGVDFTNANLSGADLRGAVLFDTNLDQALIMYKGKTVRVTFTEEK